MASEKMLTIVLNERPTGNIIPGTTFRQDIVDKPTEADLKDGQVLFQTHYLSIDPSNRGWIRDERSYLPPVQIGQVMRGLAAGKVLASKNQKIPPGSWVAGVSGWREYAVLGPQDIFVSERYPGTDVEDLAGIYCLTGLTAYFGLKYIVDPPKDGKSDKTDKLDKTGKLAVVSGAAGATGSVVGQILKMQGARVIGIAGAEDKCKWLTEELGFDLALNYKDPDFKEKFLEATKDHIDIYWDNVGGEILDLCLRQANVHARFVKCGNIATANMKEKGLVYNYLGNVTSMRIRMEGLIVTDYFSEFNEGAKDLAKWVTEGHIKVRNTIIKGGLAQAEQALHDLFEGVNTGKMFVEVKPVDE